MTRYSIETRQAILSHLREAKEGITAVEETNSAWQEDTSNLLRLALQLEKTAEEAASLMGSAFAHYAKAVEHETGASRALEQVSSPTQDAVLAGMKGHFAMAVILSSVRQVDTAAIGYQSTSSSFVRTAEVLTEIDGHLQGGIAHSHQNLDYPIEALTNYDR